MKYSMSASTKPVKGNQIILCTITFENSIFSMIEKTSKHIKTITGFKVRKQNLAFYHFE